MRLLFLELLPLLLALQLSVLYLINDDRGAFTLGFDALGLALLEDLKFLKAFDFHHEVETFLFIEPFLLKHFVFLQLFIANGDDFGVEDHLVHVFYVVDLLVHLLLSLRKQALLLLLALDFELALLDL